MTGRVVSLVIEPIIGSCCFLQVLCQGGSFLRQYKDLTAFNKFDGKADCFLDNRANYRILPFSTSSVTEWFVSQAIEPVI